MIQKKILLFCALAIIAILSLAQWRAIGSAVSAISDNNAFIANLRYRWHWGGSHAVNVRAGNSPKKNQKNAETPAAADPVSDPVASVDPVTPAAPETPETPSTDAPASADVSSSSSPSASGDASGPDPASAPSTSVVASEEPVAAPASSPTTETSAAEAPASAPASVPSAPAAEPVVSAPAAAAASLSLGTFEVCQDWEHCGATEIESNIKTIKNAGIKSISITVTEEDIGGIGSYAFYPSQFLPLPYWIDSTYVRNVISVAHAQGLKINALFNLPHSYWLNAHPDWVAVWPNGKNGNYYTDDYQHYYVPPTRILDTGECKTLLSNLMKEISGLGFDAIEINDNFQYPDENDPETGGVMTSSFDAYSVGKFKTDTGAVFAGSTPQTWSKSILGQPAVYQKWIDWRAGQVAGLLEFLKASLPSPGPEMRAYLTTWGDPKALYGIDYARVAGIFGTLYIMISPDLDDTSAEYQGIISQCAATSAKTVNVTTYFYQTTEDQSVETDKTLMLKRLQWIYGANVRSINLYDYKLIEQGGYWPQIVNLPATLK